MRKKPASFGRGVRERAVRILCVAVIDALTAQVIERGGSCPCAAAIDEACGAIA